MPADRKAKQSRRLTTAGLIAVSAATLLMMAWAIFPTAALANQKITATLTHGCNPDVWTFQITGIDQASNAPASIHVHWSNGADANVGLSSFAGGTATYSTTANLGSTVTAAETIIYLEWEGTFSLVEGPCGPTTTTTTTTTTTSPPTTTTSPPTSTTSTTSTTTSTTSTTSTSTTSPGTSVSGTSVTPTSSTTSHPGTTVSGTTVTPPGGTAFTGIENVVPLGAIALILMTGGSGLMWAGARRRRGDDSDEEA